MRWRDVTAECEAESGTIQHEGKDVYREPRYCVRKVCINESEDAIVYEIKTAFIVEKQE